MNKYYVIGVDFGTLSGRVVLVNVENGKEISSSIINYKHGVMDKKIPDREEELPQDFALQDPADYLDVLHIGIPEVLRQGLITNSEVIGIGIDFTACTILPTLEDGTPLCSLEKYANRPHAYVKLWKHHAAQKYADKLNEIATYRKEPWLKCYGNKISSEWLVPKVWQIVNEDDDIYYATDRFMEGGDWIVWHLTGRCVRNNCAAGYKAIWNKKQGYPSTDFFATLDKRLKNFTQEKLKGEILSVGDCAGFLTARAAQETGLAEGTPVAVANVDAHACVPAVGIFQPGIMLAIMGTSTCHMLMADKQQFVPGICGVVEDGIVSGYWGYEAGQSCVGDHFAWFVKNCLPADYQTEAIQAGLDFYQYLEKKAQAFRPGQNGLLALDWWNGNRSILVDVNLTGLMLGMTLQTKPEEMYRALLEATAYGTRMIIEDYLKHGIDVHKLYVTGGIANKSPLAMQIYADVIGIPVIVIESNQGPALGAAMFAAVAAGKGKGGYDCIKNAGYHMASRAKLEYHPLFDNHMIYDELFKEYVKLHDYFGRGTNDVMKHLKTMRKMLD